MDKETLHNQKNNLLTRQAVFDDILQAELKIEGKTKDFCGPWLNKQEQAINVLMSISYLERVMPLDIESDDYFFYFNAIYIYYDLPNSLRNISILMEKGAYGDALSLCRQLLDQLVKLRYFLVHKKIFKSYAEKGKDLNGKRIQIKDMWDYIAGENAYDMDYKFLSKLTHKNAETIVHRLNNNYDNILIPEFNKQYVEAVINHLMYIVYGYLNLAPLLTPYKFEANTFVCLEQFKQMTSWFALQIQSRKNQFPNSNSWSLVMEKVVGYSDSKK